MGLSLNFAEDDTGETNLHHHFDKTGEEMFFPRDYKNIQRLWNWITTLHQNSTTIKVRKAQKTMFALQFASS